MVRYFGMAAVSFPDPLSGAEIRVWADIILNGDNIFSPANIPREAVPFVLTPLLEDTFEDWTNEQCAAVVPFAVEGHHRVYAGAYVGEIPMFRECSYLLADDLREILLLVRAALKRVVAAKSN